MNVVRNQFSCPINLLLNGLVYHTLWWEERLFLQLRSPISAVAHSTFVMVNWRICFVVAESGYDPLKSLFLRKGWFQQVCSKDGHPIQFTPVWSYLRIALLRSHNPSCLIASSSHHLISPYLITSHLIYIASSLIISHHLSSSLSSHLNYISSSPTSARAHLNTCISSLPS